MKKIFYSMMAVALCACSQSDVNDVVTPPQPENNGLKFTVVDNGFVGEDGTRVKYDDGGTAITSKFEDGNTIGIYAIISEKISNNLEYDGYVPADDAYTVKNVKLTLTNGVWTPETDINLGEADLVFAYAPYRAIADDFGGNKPSFIQKNGIWTLNEGNNRFFVWPWDSYLDNSTKELFDEADWMGAATVITKGQNEIELNMKHMRGMIEVVTPKEVKLTDIKVALNNSSSKTQFQAYFVNKTDANRQKNVYRILIAEHRNANTVYVTIQDLDIFKKYTQELSGVKTGTCFRLKIGYNPVEAITVDADHPLATTLTGTTPTRLRLKGELSTDDWTTLKGLSLTALDMSQLTNEEIPNSWMGIADEAAPTTLGTNLTTLVLPNGLTTINYCGLKFPNTKTISIELPASVTTLNQNAFWHSNNLSLRIPDDSRLVTIGPSALDGLKAVYTNPGNPSLLKIPASVTKIDGSAFWGVTDLKKIIFQSNKAPEIGVNAFTNVNATICVPNKENYYGKSLFPGKTVIAGPFLTAKNYASTPDPTGSGAGTGSIGLAGLCDNDNNTFWHSPWNRAGDATYGHYIDITLPEGKTMSSLVVEYVTRAANNAVPTTVDIYTNNGEEWVKLVALPKDGGTLPTAGNETYTSDKMTPAAPFTKVRFAITKAHDKSLLNDNSSNDGAALAELTIYEDKWIDTAPATPAE